MGLRHFLLILCLPLLLGAAPSRTQTYTAGETIKNEEVTENEDNIFSYLQAGVDTVRALAVESGDLQDAAVTAAKIATDAVGAGAITAGAVGASELASGAVDVVDMATTGTAADDKAFIADSSSAGTWRTITNCTDASGNHLNYTQSTNSFSCGTTSSTVFATDLVQFSRTGAAGTGTQTVSGMTVSPTTIYIQCIDDTADEGRSWGWTDDDSNDFSAALIGATDTAVSGSASMRVQDVSVGGANDMQGEVSAFNSDGFDVTWTEQGTGPDVTCNALAFD